MFELVLFVILVVALFAAFNLAEDGYSGPAAVGCALLIWAVGIAVGCHSAKGMHCSALNAETYQTDASGRIKCVTIMRQEVK